MPTLETFDHLYQRACERKGGPKNLGLLLSKPLPPKKIQQIGDDRFLAEFSKKVFQSGFVWRVVRNKWPNFEQAFFNFEIDKVILMPDEMLEKKAQDPSIIRNYNKVKTIRENALMIQAVQQEKGSFANFVAQWPNHDIVGLWAYLKKHGARLGGNTGPYALRAIGKDTFILSQDVVAYFSQRDLISGSASSKRSLTAIQQAFNDFHQQSNLSLQEISQIISYSVGDNHVQVEY
ncbi:DNA-3-methyladenine glycosylase I [Aliiglaciecola sp. 3_MG-2023]|uniref:DNA-3-methyladenine glycosylase I n=1 Tax=Aliiglaciecola sp. 3_MG-2023 TaxID=3062644 RepID=UPI0026E35290|nr:DNA-3-methyladenine glycosylase I [Aliiglaciecola sp. 3_MG-2023]MDO6692338.1 DNA-3-methyladenine glycosylase I [Aliiglaciecola sp. 3_MG-2023]